MNFDFSDDQKTLQKAVHEHLARECPLTECRRGLETAQFGYSQKVWRGAAEMGWLGTAIPEAYGGAGLGYLELALVAEEVGHALAPIPLSSSIYLVAEALLLAGSEAQKQQYLPKLASGELIGAFAGSEGPGRLATERIATRYDGGRVSGTKLPVCDGAGAGLYLVTAEQGGHVRLALVEAGAGVKATTVGALDASRPQARLVLTGARAELLGETGADFASVERLLDRAATLLAFEQLGAATRAFELTRSFTMDRYVFGRPIASFQAIKHRLADLFVDIELARSNACFAAWALSSGSSELALAAPTARIAASVVCDLAAVEMVQMHGGIGFTWESDAHLFYRRSKHLSLLLGSPSEWRDKLIVRLAKERAEIASEKEAVHGL
jgi:alkylation response protein AidB-like acyl-CoA dehydrogenase